ncbi:MAG: radical SAM/SPASM domain-containing protein [Armatimonadota bacterium]
MTPREFTLLGIKSQVAVDGTIQAEAIGPLGPLMDSMVKQYYARISKAKVLAQRNGSNVYTLYQPPVPSEADVKLACNKLIELFTGKHWPTTATLAITHRCQCRCEHCSASDYMRCGVPEVTPEEMFSVLDQAQELGVVNIVFVGGEPLLHPRIYDYIKHVDYREARPMMFTNGWKLTDEVVEKLKDAGLYSLNVSIDSVDPNEHDRLRGLKGLWKRAMDGARRCLDAGLLVGVSTYATPQTLRDGRVEDLVLLVKEMGLHEITIFDTVPTGRLLHGAEDMLLTEDDKRALQELSQKYDKMPGLPGIKVQSWVNSDRGFGCFAGYFQFYMTSGGEITPCDFTPLSFGNVKKEPLKDIWARMTSHEAYRDRCNHCRMQDPEFRAKYIDVIPEGAQLPYRLYETDEEEQPAVASAAG